MSQQTPFGLSTILNPPLLIDGKYYPLMIRYFSSADGGAEQLANMTICTAVIEAIIDQGDGYYLLIFQRSLRASSVTKHDPTSGEVTEWVYYSNCGGNVVNHPEPYRIYGWLSEVSVRGSLVGSLAERYDVVWGNDEGYFITECKAFNYPPIGGVNFNPSGSLAVNSRMMLDFPGKEISANGENFFDGIRFEPPATIANPNATLYFNDSGTGFFDDCGFYQGSTKLTRKTFGGDPEDYPVDAALALGEYWIDPTNYQTYLSSYNIAYGTTLDSQYWVKNLTILEYTTPGRVALEGNGCTGYGSTVDDIGGVYLETHTDFENYFALIKTVDGYGAGAIQAQFGDEKAVVFWSGGFITAVKKRTRTTVNIVDESFTGNAIEFSDDLVFIWIRKVENVISFYYQELSSPVKTLIAEITLSPNIGFAAWGTLASVVWGTNQIKIVPQVIGLYRKFAGAAMISKQITETWTGLIFSKEYSLPTLAAITGCMGVKFGAYSSSGSPRRRNHYEDLGSGRVKFYSETAPDLIAFTQAATPGPPALTRGRCPRNTNQSLNLATIADPETMEPTSDPDENIWNWHDTARIYSPDFMHLNVGDTVDLRRNAVLDPTKPIVFQSNHKNSESPDWHTFDPADYIKRPVEGVFLVEQSAAEVIGIQNMCTRVSATFVRHHGRMDSKTVNEAASCISKFSDLYFTTGGLGSGEAAYSGYVENKRIVDADRSCVDHPWWSGRSIIQTNDLMLGITKDNWSDGDYSLGIGDRLYWAGLTLPQWITFGQQLSETESGAEEFHNGNDNTHVCGDGLANWRDFELGTANRPVWASIYGANYFTETGYGFGVPPPNPNNDDLYPHAPTYNFRGIPFGLPPEFTRTFRGATVKAAWIRAKFSAIKNWNWSIHVTSAWPRNARAALALVPRNVTILEIVNGTTVLDYAKIDNIIVKPYSPSYDKNALAQTSAPVSLQLVGQRKSSKNIFYEFNYNDIFLYSRVFGIPMPSQAEIDANRIYYTDRIAMGGFESFSTGLIAGGTVESGKWCKLDCKEALQALLSYGRDSKCINFQLWPGQAGVSVNAGISSLASFAKSIDWVGSISTEEISFDQLAYDFNAHGQLTSWDAMELGSIEIQLEMPNGAVKDVVLGPPINRPPMIGA